MYMYVHVTVVHLTKVYQYRPVVTGTYIDRTFFFFTDTVQGDKGEIGVKGIKGRIGRTGFPGMKVHTYLHMYL